jgi:hypothetical protein
MTLTQLSQVKRWMVMHSGRHPVELAVWNVVLTIWMLGFMGVPGALLLKAWIALPLCLVAWLLPMAYTGGRRRLHRAGRLRCDWLTAL